MSSLVVLAVALAAGSTSSPELCRGYENQIEPDMRVLESDLSRQAAAEAAGKLKSMLDRGNLEGELQYGALNQLKIIRGHLLLQQAQADRESLGSDSAVAKQSLAALCGWLGSEGFWYD